MATLDAAASSSVSISSASASSRQTDTATSESLSIVSSSTPLFDVSVSVSDSVWVSALAEQARVATASLKDFLTVLDTFSETQELNVSVSDSVTVGINLVFNGVKYDGWVVNSNSFASVRYEGFNFNSFCQYKGKYYGCATNGIHLLEGNDDNGTPIDAFISTGNIKPYASAMARIMSAYLMVKNDGSMFVRMINGDEVFTYPMTDISNAFAERRVKTGKGVKSTMFRFEIGNVDGSDFDIESFKIYPIELTRRSR